MIIMTRKSLLLLHVFVVLSLEFDSGVGDAKLMCIEKERQVLLKIKEDLIDENGQLSSWRNEEEHRNCCDWDRVFCSNISSHVIGLYFRDENLRGKLNPYHLANLSSLQTLILRGNFFDINGKLEWLGHLSSIEYLDLSNLNLSEANDWLQVVHKLPYLTKLYLYDCSLPDPTPPSLSLINSSTSLATLQLSYNHLTSSIFQMLFNFSSSLVQLFLSGNQLHGPVPHNFGNMISLEYLDLSFNQLESGFPNFFNFSSSLVELSLSDNQLQGPFPNFKIFSSFKRLDLSFNQWNGTIPESIGHLSKLEDLNVAGNSFEGEISEAHFSKLSKLLSLDLSSNSFVLNFSSDWDPPFNLDSIRLRSCKLGPDFPKWLQTQNKFFYLDISDAEISDSVPNWFWGLTPMSAVMNLSYNQFHGRIPNLSVKFPGQTLIDLSSNQIEGQIPPFLLQGVVTLNLSKNKFSGTTSFLCAFSPYLSFLDLSNNLLLGELPDCWRNLEGLKVLNLANNNFHGKIPNSIGFLKRIQFLQLSNNRINGELPSSFKNCMMLRTIQLGDNRLSGPIPAWIGDSLSNLVLLSLRSNQFNGSVPMHLCHLAHIQLLDLSSNNLSRSIPKCLYNLTALAQKGSSSPTISFSYNLPNDTGPYIPLYSRLGIGVDFYLDSALLMWKGRKLEYGKTLGLVKSIDFSSNKLAGQIPEEITALVGLVSLNLSRNNLTGEITPKIGQLSSLDFLDLSRNQLIGKIPSSLSQINGLSVLDLSDNNLSGKIPTGTQLQSFNASAYAGNGQLCGLPLPNKCPGEETSPEPAINRGGGNANIHEDEDQFITVGFYVSMALGFIVGFWGICGSLVLNSSWRYAFFKFLTDVNDKIYVVAAVNFTRMQRRLCN